MWFDRGKCSTTENLLTYKIPTFEGQSGSPIVKREKGKEFIVGIHIGSNAKGTKNIGLQLNTEIRIMINEWVGDIVGALSLGKCFFD